MSDYEEDSAKYCPECGAPLRDAWRVPLAAAPKETLTASLLDDDTLDGHITIDQTVRVYLHENGSEG